MNKPIIVGISGASGIIYGVRPLELLREMGVTTHLVMSKSAELTLHYELDMSLADVKALASEANISLVTVDSSQTSQPLSGILLLFTFYCVRALMPLMDMQDLQSSQ